MRIAVQRLRACAGQGGCVIANETETTTGWISRTARHDEQRDLHRCLDYEE